MPQLTCIGDRIPCARIDAVHSRYERTVNFLHQESLISLHTFSDPRTALSVHLEGIDLPSIRSIERTPDSSLILNDQIKLDFDERHIYPASAFEHAARQSFPTALDVSALQALLLRQIIDNPLLVTLSGVLSCSGIFDRVVELKFRAAWNYWQQGQYLTTALSFKGRGKGSSPAGDDFLCGLLLGLKTREYSEGADFSNIRTVVFEAALGNNLIVNTLLNHAYQGWADSDFVALVQSLNNDSNGLHSAVQKILMHGSSSGADSLLGFVGAWS